MKFIFFLFSALFFFTVVILTSQPTPKITYSNPKPAESLLPVLTTPDYFPILSAQGVMVKDINSGVTLYEKNPDLSLLPASTTKVMTALVAMDEYKLDDVVTIGPQFVIGQKMGLAQNEKITVKDLLYATLVYSANDAAEALARHHEKGRDHFLSLMNQKAAELNLTNTHFENPTGLDGANHVSSARDMVRLSEHAMKNPTFAKMVATKEIVVKSIDEKYSHRLTNINALLGEVEGVVGIKTGWTENARENLVTYVQRGNKKLLIGLLGSQDRFGETKELISWIYNNYSWVEVSPSSPPEASSPLSAGASGL